MDWQKLFLSPQGRIGRQDFWVGFLILFVGGFVLGLIPILGLLVGLALIYPWVCIYVKRLHDMGKTGWLVLIPFVVSIVAGVVGGVLLAGGLLGMGAGGSASLSGAAIGSLGVAGLFFLLAFLAGVGFLLWVGITPTQPGPNLYGPAPGEQAVTDVF